jgi:hypothetical protein
MDKAEQKAISDIEQFGCHVMHVFREGELPPFSYSVGIWKSSHRPELIVVGLEQIRTTPHRASGESARQNKGLERDRTAKLIQSAPIAL